MSSHDDNVKKLIQQPIDRRKFLAGAGVAGLGLMAAGGRSALAAGAPKRGGNLRIAILGGNIYGYNQTLASATLYEVNRGDFPMALAIAIVLMGMILVLMGSVALLQHRSGGLRLRFRTAAA